MNFGDPINPNNVRQVLKDLLFVVDWIQRKNSAVFILNMDCGLVSFICQTENIVDLLKISMGMFFVFLCKDLRV